VVGPALALMHDDPAHPWTVAELASHAAVSRAAFSRRFRDRVGEPPMSYLTCWRLCLAGDLLRDTDDTLATIARKVGYANAYALSAAFTRVNGVRPGEHRARAVA
jgi:transcriptional regulator GlxA family with amidase domain